MALTEDQFFEQYWPSTPAYQAYLNYVELSKRPVGKGVRPISPQDIARQEASMRNVARRDSGFIQAWQSYSAQQQAVVTGQQQQQDLERQRREAEEAAQRAREEQDRIQNELRQEQDRIQNELRQEQERIAQQQQQQAAAIQAQLERERAAVQAEQESLRAQFETERAQTETLIGEAKVKTEKQQLAAKRESTLALNVGKQTSLTKLREQQKETAPVRLAQPQRRKATIGQPGVASTRVSSRPSIGGYGGTAAGRVNPTGLNI